VRARAASVAIVDAQVQARGLGEGGQLETELVDAAWARRRGEAGEESALIVVYREGVEGRAAENL
jgi:hypothetical protein